MATVGGNAKESPDVDALHFGQKLNETAEIGVDRHNRAKCARGVYTDVHDPSA